MWNTCYNGEYLKTKNAMVLPMGPMKLTRHTPSSKFLAT